MAPPHCLQDKLREASEELKTSEEELTTHKRTVKTADSEVTDLKQNMTSIEKLRENVRPQTQPFPVFPVSHCIVGEQEMGGELKDLEKHVSECEKARVQVRDCCRRWLHHCSLTRGCCVAGPNRLRAEGRSPQCGAAEPQERRKQHR